VADGIGGYHGGAEASSVIVQTVPLVLQTAKEASRHDPPSMQMAIERSLEASHRRMVRFANRHPNYDRMGATTALAVVAGDTAYFTSVGDCRVYLARDNQLHRLTTDQTYVQAMLDAGVLSAAEARTSGFRNIVTNSVSVKGLQERPNVEAIPLQLGDRLLLVTDGLTNALDDEAIESMVFDGSPQETADELVLEALRQDSHDNIACVVVKVVNGRGST
jgi:protein phosphatase